MAADPTLEVYEQRGPEWTDARTATKTEAARSLGDEVTGRLLDLGCGPGWHLPHLGAGAIGLDGAAAMLQLAAQRAPGHPLVRADLRHLPFRDRGLHGLWAKNSLVHLRQQEVPAALAEVHRVLAVDGIAMLHLFSGPTTDAVAGPDTDFPGRRYSFWTTDHLIRAVEGAGFELIDLDDSGPDDFLVLRLHRRHSLPDTVGPRMRLLISGLNPSPHASDTGVGFSRPGNRFWPAALDAGIVTIDRDPRHALHHHHVGMTDLVKRTTRRADELSTAEYQAGVGRLDHLCAWLEPGAVCFVGLAGWRAAVNTNASAGWQEQALGGRPVYVMPSTSGLNASSSRADLAAHLTAAFAGPPTAGADSGS
ncbi:MAG: methyltransferase domain-containing protein [Actinomycetia bacterium]|nr:methyltransferase domain-containing protein [Actinomycetes bacterium]